jgi:hypothetical protein
MACDKQGAELKEILIRFVVGGLIVSVFSMLGDLLKPKSFAGLFGAAPSVALATLSLTITTRGRFYAATECRSMVLGAVGFFFYAWGVSRLLMRYKLPALSTTAVFIFFWFISTFSLWAAFLR